MAILEILTGLVCRRPLIPSAGYAARLLINVFEPRGEIRVHHSNIRCTIYAEMGPARSAQYKAMHPGKNGAPAQVDELFAVVHGPPTWYYDLLLESSVASTKHYKTVVPYEKGSAIVAPAPTWVNGSCSSTLAPHTH